MLPGVNFGEDVALDVSPFPEDNENERKKKAASHIGVGKNL